MRIEPKAYIISYEKLSDTLESEIRIASYIHIPSANSKQLYRLYKKSPKYTGVWDTGATMTFITQKIVDYFQLPPFGHKRFQGPSYCFECDTYWISLFLPNHVCIPWIEVGVGNMTEEDILIGMDVITQGDFAISNRNKKTVFSFRTPSQEVIDFTRDNRNKPHAFTFIDR